MTILTFIAFALFLWFFLGFLTWVIVFGARKFFGLLLMFEPYGDGSPFVYMRMGAIVFMELLVCMPIVLRLRYYESQIDKDDHQ